MHYAMGLMPQCAQIISRAIEAEEGIEFGGCARYNVMTAVTEQ